MPFGNRSKKKLQGNSGLFDMLTRYQTTKCPMLQKIQTKEPKKIKKVVGEIDSKKKYRKEKIKENFKQKNKSGRYSVSEEHN